MTSEYDQDIEYKSRSIAARLDLAATFRSSGAIADLVLAESIESNARVSQVYLDELIAKRDGLHDAWVTKIKAEGLLLYAGWSNGVAGKERHDRQTERNARKLHALAKASENKYHNEALAILAQVAEQVGFKLE